LQPDPDGLPLAEMKIIAGVTYQSTPARQHV